MELGIAPLFSSSKGNSTLVWNEDTNILIDAGMPLSNIREQMRLAGRDLRQLDGILITHEHSDHIKGAGIISRQCDVPVYANEKTWAAMEKTLGEVASRNRRIITTEDFYIGDLCVQGFCTSHDAACSMGYTVSCGGKKIALMTDLGKVTSDILETVSGSSIVILEANYDPQLLLYGPYPEFLKRRIASTKGHLSNEDSGQAAAKLVTHGCKGFILGHLSETNNRYRRALDTVRRGLEEAGIVVGRDAALTAAKRDGLTGVFHARSRTPT
ncbi:MAG: MBL fold metallo-hydrolase [Clostridia bacterium]|nr:MBL fold metallo-hydrolase [Clostridia bacterium]